MPKKKDAKGAAEHGYEFDPQLATAHLSRADAQLAWLIEAAGPFQMAIRTMHSPFEALARNIVYQQLNGTAAAAIHARVLALAARRRLRPEDVLEASDEALRAAGLSRNKLDALRDLAAKTLDGTVPSLARLKRMNDEEIVERLTRVRGIGRWTVEMLLMSRLGRPDVLPVGDFGVRKGFSILYRREVLPTPKELTAYAERWRPYRTVASWYMWRAVELPPEGLAESRPTL
ncbi:MAG: DNA-3-methyladenine glycosylase family protein [Blastocatellia bacterium]